MDAIFGLWLYSKECGPLYALKGGFGLSALKQIIVILFCFCNSYNSSDLSQSFPYEKDSIIKSEPLKKLQ